LSDASTRSHGMATGKRLKSTHQLRACAVRGSQAACEPPRRPVGLARTGWGQRCRKPTYLRPRLDVAIMLRANLSVQARGGIDRCASPLAGAPLRHIHHYGSWRPYPIHREISSRQGQASRVWEMNQEFIRFDQLPCEPYGTPLNQPCARGSYVRTQAHPFPFQQYSPSLSCVMIGVSARQV
jgi:hypothetical protein